MTKTNEEMKSLLKQLENNVRDRRWSDIKHEEELKNLKNDIDLSISRLKNLEERMTKKFDLMLKTIDTVLKKLPQEEPGKEKRKRNKFVIDSDDESGYSSLSKSSDDVEVIDTKFSLPVTKPKVKIEKGTSYVTPQKKAKYNKLFYNK